MSNLGKPNDKRNCHNKHCIALNYIRLTADLRFGFLQLAFFWPDLVEVRGVLAKWAFLLFVGLPIPVEGLPLLIKGLSLLSLKLPCDNVCFGRGGGEGGHDSPPSSSLHVGDGDSIPSSLTVGEEFRRFTFLTAETLLFS